MSPGCLAHLCCLVRHRHGNSSPSSTSSSSSATNGSADDRTLQALDVWAEQVRLDIYKTGFVAAFKHHVDRFAIECYKHPQYVERTIERWLRSDPFTAHFADTIQLLDSPVRPDWDSAPFHTDRDPDPGIHGVVERHGAFVKIYQDELFTNWAGTVHHVPSYTFVPRTKLGIVNIVRFAIREGMRVRVSGSRHSWTHVFGATGQVTISMMEIGAAVHSERALDMPDHNPSDNELEAIAFEGVDTKEDGRTVGRVRIGAAATSDHFRAWALSEEGGNWQWMLAALPILVSITSAGWTQVMCHGAGIDHPCVSDFCVEAEFVNCRGHLQTVSDKRQMRAVRGSFGLLGVLVSQVFLLDPLKLANFFPLKVPALLAVPPFRREDVPQCDEFDSSIYSDEALYKARLRFELDCKKFYAEWFWFPFQKQCWINCWDVAENTGARPVYPDAEEVEKQNIQAALARVFEVTLLRVLPARWQAELMGYAAMRLLPGGELLRSNVPDALHFRRGIHLMPVRDCELEIEIPGRVDGTPDFSVCQKAWWMAISAVYEMLPAVPMRTTLEMRICGGSDTTLSTQRFNEFGTCSIEVLSNSVVDEADWQRFVDLVMERWSSLKHPLTGLPLRVRPHFAKEWPTKLRGLPIRDFLKKEYAREIPEFKELLAESCRDGGYQLRDAFEVFGNEVFLDFLSETVPP